jgi:hypothetical protein
MHLNVDILSKESTVNVLKCLANIQSMDSSSRDIFVKTNDCIPFLLKAIQIPAMPMGPLFLILRLCFFVTVVDTDIAENFMQSGILDTFATLLNEIREGNVAPSSWVTNDMLINELLKITFNVTLDRSVITSSLFGTGIKLEEVEDGPEVKKFEFLLSEIIQTCLSVPLGNPSMGPPHLHAINSLVNFPFHPFANIWLANDKFTFPKLLLQILKDMIQVIAPETGEEDLDDNYFGHPIDQCLLMTLILFKKLSVNENARTFLRNEMMPTDIDRTKPLNKGRSFTAGIVRVMTSVRLLHTRDFLCDLLVTLCDGNSSFI